MNFLEFKTAVLSRIDVNDKYFNSKTRQLRNWCYAFFSLFRNASSSHTNFVSFVLSDDDCWEKTDSVHGIKLKRKMIAKILVQLKRWKTEANPLNISERLRVACWCCLEEDIVTLFACFKRLLAVEDYDSARIKELVMELSTASWSDDLIKYWLNVITGYFSAFPLKDMDLYEYGLDISLKKIFIDDRESFRGHVEGVKFFWNKIKSLPEEKLSARRKHIIFMKAAVCAAGMRCANNPEIFEFFITQMRPNKCKEFLKRELVEYKQFRSFDILWYLRRFDQMLKLFDCFQPDEVKEGFYRGFLNTLNVIQFSKNYANEAANLFMHVWMREGFDKHRELVLKIEMCDPDRKGIFLLSFTRRDYMEPVWAILDKATRDQVKEFMNSKHAKCITTILQNRGDLDSLNKFLSYKNLASKFETENPLLSDVNFVAEPEIKQRKEE